MDESVRPVLDAGLADLVEADHKLTSEVWLEPTHGHTPGHVSVRISSGGAGRRHHRRHDAPPLPDRAARVALATSTGTPSRAARRAARRSRAGRAGGYLVIGTHFAGPTAGKIVRDGDAYRLAV